MLQFVLQQSSSTNDSSVHVALVEAENKPTAEPVTSAEANAATGRAIVMIGSISA